MRLLDDSWYSLRVCPHCNQQMLLEVDDLQPTKRKLDHARVQCENLECFQYFTTRIPGDLYSKLRGETRMRKIPESLARVRRQFAQEFPKALVKNGYTTVAEFHRALEEKGFRISYPTVRAWHCGRSLPQESSAVGLYILLGEGPWQKIRDDKLRSFRKKPFKVKSDHWLPVARYRKGWSQRALAEKLRERGLKARENYISMWENRKAIPAREIREALYDLLGVDPVATEQEWVEKNNLPAT